ncbi:uncharacterized protein LOC112459309 isoform X2 [Temnothorax curvispinosus]|uniref:Uncharacterized protein LOC112459309 isoform X2 n=1 Tax=Temnothorax curvispinosus TaxID=300111 RepID=A0A6J1QEH5_9HYME|nr:uncharacterized protein LOC112459309 isoform X2 [Temnothorax curvispinosus]
MCNSRGCDLLVNQASANSDAITGAHAVPADDARDPGMLNSQVPPVITLDMEMRNTRATVEREICRVCGSKLIESTAPMGEVESNLNRFPDDQEGKVSLSLRLPPEQTLTRKDTDTQRTHVRARRNVLYVVTRPTVNALNRARKIVEGGDASVLSSQDRYVNPGAWPTLPEPRGINIPVMRLRRTIGG